MLDRDHDAILDRDETRAFRAGLLDAAALKIAGKQDVGRSGERLARMDVAQRPIGVAVIGELLDAAGGVVQRGPRARLPPYAKGRC